MINSRLVCYLERNKLISPMQCGCRKQRSTTNHLLRLESFAREVIAQRQHAVGVFFDFEKAYESTWKFGIMRDLHWCVYGTIFGVTIGAYMVRFSV